MHRLLSAYETKPIKEAIRYFIGQETSDGHDCESDRLGGLYYQAPSGTVYQVSVCGHQFLEIAELTKIDLEALCEFVQNRA